MEIMNTDHDDSNNNISDSCKRNVVFIPLQKDKLDKFRYWKPMKLVATNKTPSFKTLSYASV